MVKIKRILFVLFGCFCLCVQIVPVSAHYDTAYWNETSSSGSHSNWMSRMKDSTRVSQMSIPGTHDTMAHKADLLGRDIARTQSMSLSQQLESGIRFIDIRAKYKNTYFQIHHGDANTGYNLDDVLTTTKTFLQNHPTETVFMRFQQENSSANDTQMANLFRQYHNKYKQIFWNPYESENSSNPQMKELRGKIVLISDVLSITDGLNYRLINKQDAYDIPNNWELYTKWLHIKNQLNIAKNTGEYNQTIYMNYLSGSGGVFPYFVASGHASPGTSSNRLATGLTEPGFHAYYPDFPRVDWFGVFATIAFEGTNTLTANWIGGQKPNYVGFIVADFPGERLIKQVIDCNFRNEISGEKMLYLKAFPNYVVDYNQHDGNVTMWDNNKTVNQKWIFEYDESKNAYKIRSKVNRNTILAWNDYLGGNNVFTTPDQSKLEHFWILDKQENGYIIRNYKNRNLILTVSSSQSPYNSLNMIVRERYADNKYNVFTIA